MGIYAHRTYRFVESDCDCTNYQRSPTLCVFRRNRSVCHKRWRHIQCIHKQMFSLDFGMIFHWIWLLSVVWKLRSLLERSVNTTCVSLWLLTLSNSGVVRCYHKVYLIYSNLNTLINIALDSGANYPTYSHYTLKHT